jgi:AraC family transcriptional regulator, transcriptional activator of pobA
VTTRKKTTVYTHSELIALEDAVVGAAFGGLHVSAEEKFANFKLLGQHFRSDFFAIMVVTGGEIEVAFNLRRYILRKNNLVVAPPNAIKQLIKASPDAMGMFVSFTTSFLSQAGMPKHNHDLLNYFTSKGNPVWSLQADDAKALREMIRDILMRCQAVEARPFGKEQLYHTFFVFMYEMAAQSQKYAPDTIAQVSRKEAIVIRFAGLVTLHVHNHRAVQHYAGLLHITPKYLTETVKEISGRSAGEVIDDFVILECKLLLDDPQHSIAQVAAKMNFSDQSFFGKFFKRHTGISPKKYRADLFQ